MALNIQKSVLLVQVFWLFCFCLYVFTARSQIDTLQQGKELKDGEFLMSTGQVFTLGFFTVGERATLDYSEAPTTENRLIGIWYSKDESKKPVWIANRDKPISGKSGKLEVDNNGALKISQNGSSPIFLKTSQKSVRTVAAVLSDRGNFELREVDSDGSKEGKILWQSFDYPTDTLIPGMKLGFNFRTGQKWRLTSWVNDQVPAKGPFTLEADPNSTALSAQLIMYRRGEIYWKSGIWQDKTFKNLQDYLYHFDLVSNNDEIYFVFSAVNWFIIFPMYQLGADGKILMSDPALRFSGSRRGGPQMNTLSDCTNHYWTSMSQGCAKHELPQCRSGKWFEHTKGYVISDGFLLDKGKYILGIKDCEAKCLNDCSCVAYASIYINGTGCEFWSNTTQLHEDGYKSYREFYIQRDAKPEGSKKFWWIWLIVATAGTLLLLSLAWLGCRIKRQLLHVTRFFWLLSYFVLRSLKAKIEKLYYHLQDNIEGGTQQMEQIRLAEQGSSSGLSSRLLRSRKLRIVAKRSHGVKLFSFESMAKATENFSSSNRLGHGGFGVVYKGMLENAQEIAIKRLSTTSKQGRVEFMNEMKVVAKLQHTNLIKLIGCCAEKGEKIVVYEYMKNKSLDYFLFDSSRKSLLDWKKRFNIIDGVAQGLLYLHKYSRLKIIHRDLKAGNILLDEDMNPRISDFGMARIFEKNRSGANTNRVVGTPGYMPPEYRIEGHFSVKSDVFSFGVLLLEIVTSKKNYESYCSDRPLNLVGHAWELWMENRGSELIDQALNLSNSDIREAMKCINVGLLCVQHQPAERPDISAVVAMINSEATQLPVPRKPAFFVEHDLLEADHLRDPEQACSNEASISDMDAR